MNHYGDYDIPLQEYVATLEAELNHDQHQWLRRPAADKVQAYLHDMRQAALRQDSGEVSRLTALLRRVYEHDCCCDGSCGDG